MKNYIFVLSILLNVILIFVLAVERINVVDNLCIKVLENTYISGIICSIISVFIVIWGQVKISKIKIKQDLRCSEIIFDVTSEIDSVEKIAKEIPEIKGKIGEDEYKVCCEKVYDFYKKNKNTIDFIVLAIASKNNVILLESVQACFFLNLNFKILGIVNNIKNRLPNISEGNKELERIYIKLEKNESGNEREENIRLFALSLSYFVKDLVFLAHYWNDLFMYLEFDSDYYRKFFDVYASNYPGDNIFNHTQKEQKKIIADIDKIVNKELNRKKNIYEKITSLLIRIT